MFPLPPLSRTALPALLGLLLLSDAWAPTARSEPAGIRSLATELARLRSEVDALSSQLEAQKSDTASQLQSLTRQRTELDAQLRREAVRIAELERRIASHRAKLAARSERQEALRPLVLEGAAALRAAISKTLPFAREDRLAEIDKITDTLTKKLLSPGDALARLWDRVEDELRLSRESGLFRQIVRLDGREHLVEVARLGTVLLYFRTQDGRYGVLRNRGKDWTPQVLSAERHHKQLERLFESFRKQVRVGFFILPEGLPAARGGAQ